MKFIINRQELYNCLWTGEQVQIIAKKYSMTATNLKEICSFLKIPIPSDSTRYNIRRKKPYNLKWLSSNVNIPKELEVEVIKEGLKSVIDFEGKRDTGEVLSFLNQEDRIELINQISSLVGKIGDDIVEDELLVKFKKKILSSYKNSKFPHQYQSVHNLRNDYYKDFVGPLNIQVFSLESVDRIFKILNNIYSVIKELNGSLDNNFNFVIRNEVVYFEFYEMQTLEKHQITKEEQKELNDYQKGIVYWEPSIRKEDYVFNGRLVLNLKESGYWESKSIKFRDGKSVSLENQLKDIVIALYEVSEVEKQKRIEYEIKMEKERIEKEEQERYIESYNLELSRTKDLVLKANDFHQAQIIREYISHAGKSSISTQDWIDWANGKADWMDPEIAIDDNYLGKKELGKNPLDMNEISKRRW